MLLNKQIKIRRARFKEINAFEALQVTSTIRRQTCCSAYFYVPLSYHDDKKFYTRMVVRLEGNTYVVREQEAKTRIHQDVYQRRRRKCELFFIFIF